jgi:hypothetical protein
LPVCSKDQNISQIQNSLSLIILLVLLKLILAGLPS